VRRLAIQSGRSPVTVKRCGYAAKGFYSKDAI
jgi:hypothetical protein